jgi:sugar lactone lactonase YvrE
MNTSVTRKIALCLVLLLPSLTFAHPGSGIAVDRSGNVYFIDTGAGVWKIDTRGQLTNLGGPRFHWMALDLDDRFANTKLPSGALGDVVRVGSKPGVLVSSDFPLAIGLDGNLYYSMYEPGAMKIYRLAPSGERSVLVNLPAKTVNGSPLENLKGLTVAPDGSLYFTENDAVRRVTMRGEISTVISKVHLEKCVKIPGMTGADNPLLRGLSVNAAGTIFVAADGCGSVLEISRAGKIIVRSTSESPWSPTATAFFGNDLYALEYLHTETETKTSRRDWVPRVRKITGPASKIIATVKRD